PEFAARSVPSSGPAPRTPSRADQLYTRVVEGQESFWDAIYTPFMERDLTRGDLRAVISRGLTETHGSYTALLRLFHMDRREYKRFLNVLQKHGCHLPVSSFRSGAARRPPARASESFARDLRSA